MRGGNSWAWLVGAAGIAYLLYADRQQAGTVLQSGISAAETGVDDVTAAIAGWKQVQAGPQWVPVINAAEMQYGIPTDLLARMAYQESHFRPSIIDGTTASPAGALGILQLMPQYFNTVQRPIPFSTQDTADQINQAAGQLLGLMNHFNDWGLAVAAYNDGQGNVDKYVAGTRPLPAETSTYVADVLADVPLNGATVPA